MKKRFSEGFAAGCRLAGLGRRDSGSQLPLLVTFLAAGDEQETWECPKMRMVVPTAAPSGDTKGWMRIACLLP